MEYIGIVLDFPYHCNDVHHLPNDNQNCKNMYSWWMYHCIHGHMHLFLQHIHSHQMLHSIIVIK